MPRLHLQSLKLHSCSERVPASCQHRCQNKSLTLQCETSSWSFSVDLYERFSLFLSVFQVVYALLMPASATLGEDASDFQYNFLKSGGLPLVLSMLTRNNFLPSADMETRRGAYLNALKIAKLLLTAVGFGHVKAVAEACQPNAEGNIPVSPVRPHPQTVTQKDIPV